ncbi:hypothetical protein [Bradyrhizobium valentinum]|uniref:hypothetical protein n=1 Tax=Bradyrhizobium valentinum TaxID=1518501 RepID=UPI0012E38EDC|nr:hypothetical protein [Bradyrhizobium valentinum]
MSEQWRADERCLNALSKDFDAKTSIGSKWSADARLRKLRAAKSSGPAGFSVNH